MTIRTRDRKKAQKLATNENLSFGLNLLDGFYYIGTDSELEEIGVVTLQNPERTLEQAIA